MQSNYIQKKSSALLLTASYLYPNNHKECEQQSKFDFSMKIIITYPSFHYFFREMKMSNSIPPK